jgi:hypothetical protein
MDAREYETDVLRSMTPADKLRVMRGLIRQAYDLKAAWIRLQHPDLAEEEVRARARDLVAGERAEFMYEDSGVGGDRP